LKLDLDLATLVIGSVVPAVEEVTAVLFEYAPPENYTKDNSAFDVAIEFRRRDSGKGLLGLECKYTDTFSQKEYDSGAYRMIFAGRREGFRRQYDDYLVSRYNQLFRNQLIAESMITNNHYDTVTTGLFCHESDESALKIGLEFQNMLKDGDQRFMILTYSMFIEAVQRLSTSAVHRDWSMMLWARYLGLGLSETAFQSYRHGRF
jgi:hypothetical protein